ncbi:MAG TPA: hypothetical protein VJ654_13000 [Noviherbaspirillum sp.]|nr:hypothetical protein [Noviherbaspirillum sp.]
MDDFERDISTAAEMVELLASLPKDVRIVSDVGMSMFSGWGDLKRVRYIAKYNAVELEFN